MNSLEKYVTENGVPVDMILDALDKDERRKKFFQTHAEEIGGDYDMDVYAQHMIHEMIVGGLIT